MATAIIDRKYFRRSLVCLSGVEKYCTRTKCRLREFGQYFWLRRRLSRRCRSYYGGGR